MTILFTSGLISYIFYRLSITCNRNLESAMAVANKPTQDDINRRIIIIWMFGFISLIFAYRTASELDMLLDIHIKSIT